MTAGPTLYEYAESQGFPDINGADEDAGILELYSVMVILVKEGRRVLVLQYL